MAGAAAVVAGRLVVSEVVFCVILLLCGERAHAGEEVENCEMEPLRRDIERIALVDCLIGNLVAMMSSTKKISSQGYPKAVRKGKRRICESV